MDGIGRLRYFYTSVGGGGNAAAIAVTYVIFVKFWNIFLLNL